MTRARSNTQLLYVQQQRAILEPVHKIYRSVCPAYLNDLFERVQNVYNTVVLQPPFPVNSRCII